MGIFSGLFIKRISQPVDLDPVTVRVHIVPSWKDFPESQRRKEVSACATTADEIWILGEEYKGEILLDQRALGHELQHILHWRDGRVRNPDK